MFLILCTAASCIDLAERTSANCIFEVAEYLVRQLVVGNTLVIAFLARPLVVGNTLAVACLVAITVTIPCLVE